MKIFCDLDGTLLDVAPRHYIVYTEVAQLFNGKPLPQPEYWDLKRKKVKWPELLPQSGISPDRLNDFLAEFIPRIEDPRYLELDRLFPGALATLENLAAQSDCYLVSLRRQRQPLLDEITRLNLAPHFKAVLTGHSESDGYDVKIALIKQHLGDHKGVIIGDTEADIIAGRELGLTAVAVTSGIRDQQFLAALKPDHLFPSFAQIPTSVLSA